MIRYPDFDVVRIIYFGGNPNALVCFNLYTGLHWAKALVGNLLQGAAAPKPKKITVRAKAHTRSNFEEFDLFIDNPGVNRKVIAICFTSTIIDYAVYMSYKSVLERMTASTTRAVELQTMLLGIRKMTT